MPLNKRYIVYIEGLGSLFYKNTIMQSVLKFALVNIKGKRIFCNLDERERLGQPSDYVSGGIGIDLNYFKNVDEYGGVTNKFRLLYVGRLIADKGVLDAIQILRILLNRGLDVELTLVGEIYSNNPTSLSESDINDLERDLSKSIRFAGYSDDVRGWYKKSDLLLLPSKREGFPVCVMEANAMGIPAICFSVPGCKDAITPGLNGFLIPAFDLIDYADTIEHVVKSNLLEDLSSSSISYANTNFDIHKKNDSLIRIVNKM